MPKPFNLKVIVAAGSNPEGCGSLVCGKFIIKSIKPNVINEGGTMAIIARIIKIFKADIHGVMDHLEDRGLLLKQHLRDMEAVLNRKEAKLIKMTALHGQVQKDLAEYSRQRAALEQDLTVAVRKKKDDIARMLIKKMRPLQNLMDELTRQLKTLDEEKLQLNHHLQQQRHRYEQFKYRTAEYLHKAQMQDWEKNVLDPVSVGGYAEPTDQEIELELLKRKEALGAAA
jgi:phage shock protein A